MALLTPLWQNMDMDGGAFGHWLNILVWVENTCSSNVKHYSKYFMQYNMLHRLPCSMPMHGWIILFVLQSVAPATVCTYFQFNIVCYTGINQEDWIVAGSQEIDGSFEILGNMDRTSVTVGSDQQILGRAVLDHDHLHPDKYLKKHQLHAFMARKLKTSISIPTPIGEGVDTRIR